MGGPYGILVFFGLMAANLVMIYLTGHF